jgi:hypothetical protein
MTTTSTKIPAIIKSMSTKKLIETFIETGKVNDENISIVRGWLMDELTIRDPEAMDAFLDSDDWDDEALLKYYKI